MNPKLGLHSAGDRGLLVVVCAVVLIPGDTLAYLPTLSLEQAQNYKVIQYSRTRSNV